jgi:hypothetical protein
MVEKGLAQWSILRHNDDGTVSVVFTDSSPIAADLVEEKYLELQLADMNHPYEKQKTVWVGL